MNTHLKNIEVNNMSLISQIRETQMVKTSMFKIGIVKFNTFALVQFCEGADLVPEVEGKTAPTVEMSVFKTYVRINNELKKALVQKTDVSEMELSRKQVQILKNWLELRIKHCEKECDNHSEKFNPDTYIKMRYLMVELKELLLGDILY